MSWGWVATRSLRRGSTAGVFGIVLLSRSAAICGLIVTGEAGSRGSDVVVVDASALLRLFLADGPFPAGLEAAMERGGRSDAVLLVPDLCWLELASALLKQVQRNLLSREEAGELFDDLRRLPLRSFSASDSASELSVHAFSLALDHGLSAPPTRADALFFDL